MQDYSIRWGDTLPPFAGPGAELPDDDYAIEAMADGTNFGNPQALIEVVKSLLTDGSLAVLEGWDNREAPIRLRISAPTAVAGPALADAEKALMAAVLATSKGPLVYVPPAQDSATCVFDVVSAKLERDTSDGWDLEEIRREYRFYLLTLTCLPFARTEESVVVPALGPPPVTPSTVVVDNCASLTNWTASVGLTGPPPTSADNTSTHAALTRTAAVAMGGTTPYLKITANATYSGATVTPYFMVDDAHYPVIAQMGNVYYIQPPENFGKLVAIAALVPGWTTIPTSSIQITEIARTNVLPSSGSTRQQARTATVTGSAPTQAAIQLFDGDGDPLGTDILVHTSSNTNWQPPLRPYRTNSATVTPDAAMVSGSRNTLASPMYFRFPASRLTPGTYALMARMNVAVAGTLSWQAAMVEPSIGAGIVGTSVVTSGSATLATTGGAYQILNLAALQLPVLRAEADQAVSLFFTGTADMSVDEMWLFNLDDGVLTWIADSESMRWIEIRSPELGAARPSVYGGRGAMGTSPICVDWKCKSFGVHRFDPGLMQVFTVTSTSLVSQSELEFYPRYHSHVEGSAA